MTSSKGKGRLFIISAPSGAGKSTVINLLVERRENLILSVSATTRAPRDGEVDGSSYHFVSHESFKQMISRGEFLEYAEYVGELYGTPKKPIFEYLEAGKDVLLEIEIQGAKQVMEQEPGVISIFIVPPDIDELERRLRGRGTDSEEKLAARLDRAARELKEKDIYTYIVVNDELNRTVDEIIEIIENPDSHADF